MNEQELAELRERIRLEEREKIEVELLRVDELRVELREKVRAEVEVELAAKFERRGRLVEFAAEVCADGEGAGLAAKAEDVVGFLDGLDDDQVVEAMALLKGKVVDLREIGSTGDGDRSVVLDEAYLGHLRKWMASDGNTVAGFFEVNEEELGDMGQYDLSEFEG